MRDQLARFGKRHLIELLEAFHQVAVAGLLVRHIDRRVAMQARAGLLRRLLALGVSLVVEHEGVPAFFAEILREGVAGPHRFQARILLDARLRDDGARVGLGRRARLGFAAAVARALLVHGAAVVIVLQREILAPDRGVFGVVGQFDDAEERIPRLLLALERSRRARSCRGSRRRRREDEDAEDDERSSAVKVQQTIFEGEFAHRFLFRMSDARVAADARTWSLSAARAGIDVVDDVLMTFAAGIFRHAPAAFLDLDRVVKIAGGEGERMKEAVLGLREVFGHEAGRRVAIVAGGDRAMARLHPGIEMVLHDVAVGAGLRVVREIRPAVGVDEGVATDSCRQPKQHADRDGCDADDVCIPVEAIRILQR